MTTKELIQVELKALTDTELKEIYKLIKQYTHARRTKKKKGMLSRLKQIQIDGPQDFAAQHNAYVIGARRA